jgi:hypothetical protein
MLNQVVVVGRIEQLKQIDPTKIKIVIKSVNHKDESDFISAFLSNADKMLSMPEVGALVGIKGKITCRSVNAPLSIDIEKLTFLQSGAPSSTAQ